MVCANAGIGVVAAAAMPATTTTTAWYRVMAVNLDGVVHTVKATVPGDARAGRWRSRRDHLVGRRDHRAAVRVRGLHDVEVRRAWAGRVAAPEPRRGGHRRVDPVPGPHRHGDPRRAAARPRTSSSSGSRERWTRSRSGGPWSAASARTRPYIFSHGEFADEFQQLFDEIVAAVPRRPGGARRPGPVRARATRPVRPIAAPPRARLTPAVRRRSDSSCA